MTQLQLPAFFDLAFFLPLGKRGQEGIQRRFPYSFHLTTYLFIVTGGLTCI